MERCRSATARMWSAASRHNRRAVEKAGPWERGKTKSRFSPVSTAPWKSLGGIPTFPPLRRRFLFPFPERKQESPRRQADAGSQGLLAKADRSRVNKTGQIDKLRTEQGFPCVASM